MQSGESLPIHELGEDIRAAAVSPRRFIIDAPTGSGKSTQVPQILRDARLLGDSGTVVVLEPRRIAARLLARRVSGERSGALGEEVGYQVRHEGASSPATRILYVTEGVLLRRMLDDPMLEGIAAILFDEFHERHLYGDVTLARAHMLQRERRPDLILGVMSATLAVDMLTDYLAPCAHLRSEGRSFPVEIRHSGNAAVVSERSVWEQAAWHCNRLVQEFPDGDVLIFMPGAYEIHKTLEALESQSALRNCVRLPLHGELTPQAQDAAVDRYDRRKIVVATNVAETSLTIDGVRIVIDSGLARIPVHDPNRGINTILVRKISRGSADQRAGRAGRTAPGVCLRLWSRKDHEHRPEHEAPEVRRLDLTEIALTLKAGGVRDLAAFAWIDAPADTSLRHALATLVDLGALEHPEGSLTPIGERMAAFALHPRYSRMLLTAAELRCLPTVALLAAFAQGRSFLLNLSDRRKAERREELLHDESAQQSDFFILLRAWNLAASRGFDTGFCREWGIHARTARQAGQTADQFLRTARRAGLPIDDTGNGEDALRKCLLSGFADQLAKRLDRGTLRCAVVHGRKGEIRRQSVVQNASLLVSSEIEERDVRGDVTVLLGMNTAIEEAWLDPLFPGSVAESTTVVYDATQRRVVARRERRFRDLVLESHESDDVPLDDAARLLAIEVREGRLNLKQWDASIERWIARVNFLAHHGADLGFHPIGPEERLLILEQVCYGALSYREIKDRPVRAFLQDWLPPELQPLVDQWAPEQIGLPRGGRARIRYEEDGSAVLSATVQQLYDAPTRFPLAGGRTVARIEILAPNRRPVQVTDDLDSFWKNTYPDVKKQLGGRYPKHEWR